MKRTRTPTKETRNQYGEQSLFPEIVMWRAVIERAMWDSVYCRPRLLQRISKPISIRVEPTTIINADFARRWFIAGDKDFRNVCDLADLNHSRVREIAIDMIDRFDALVTIIKHLPPVRIAAIYAYHKYRKKPSQRLAA